MMRRREERQEKEERFRLLQARALLHAVKGDKAAVDADLDEARRVSDELAGKRTRKRRR